MADEQKSKRCCAKLPGHPGDCFLPEVIPAERLVVRTYGKHEAWDLETGESVEPDARTVDAMEKALTRSLERCIES